MTLWFTSDSHFGHSNLIHKFTLRDKVTPARSFESVEAMDELMIKNWNERVKPSDHVYHLGDVAMVWKHAETVLPRLNGHKRLIRGNHDIFKTKLYAKYFEEIMGCRVLDRLLFTHIPIAPWCFGRAYRANVHGHVHLSEPLFYRVPNPRGTGGFVKSVLYVNISVERTNYAPVSFDQIQSWVRAAEVH